MMHNDACYTTFLPKTFEHVTANAKPHSDDVGVSGECGSLCVWKAEADDDASGWSMDGG